AGESGCGSITIVVTPSRRAASAVIRASWPPPRIPTVQARSPSALELCSAIADALCSFERDASPAVKAPGKPRPAPLARSLLGLAGRRGRARLRPRGCPVRATFAAGPPMGVLSVIPQGERAAMSSSVRDEPASRLRSQATLVFGGGMATGLHLGLLMAYLG